MKCSAVRFVVSKQEASSFTLTQNNESVGQFPLPLNLPNSWKTATVSLVQPTFFHYYHNRLFFFFFPNTCHRNSSQSFKRFSYWRWAFHANNGSILVPLEEKQQICLESESEDGALVPFSPLCHQYVCLSLLSVSSAAAGIRRAFV